MTGAPLSLVIGEANVNLFTEAVQKSRNSTSDVEIIFSIPKACEATIFQVLASEDAVVCVFRSSRERWLSVIDRISPISVAVVETIDDGRDFQHHYLSSQLTKELQQIAPQISKEDVYQSAFSRLGVYSQTDHKW